MTNESTSKNSKMIVTAAAAVGALLGAAGIAGAVVNAQADGTTPSATIDDSTSTLESTTDDAATDDAAPDDATTDDDATGNEADEANETREGRRGSDETPLTGQVADDVTAAALAAVPGGTVERLETDSSGAAYEAHMLDADGNPVTVTFDASYTLLDTIAGGGGRGDGHGKGHGEGRGGHDESPLTGQVADDVAAAALAAVPGGTVGKVEAEDHGSAAYEAHVTDADGNDVRVTLDESFAVVDITPGR